MRVTYDSEADAAYIYLREIEGGGAKHTCPIQCEHASGMIVLDLDADGRLIGIEVVGAQSGLPSELLALAPAS